MKINNKITRLTNAIDPATTASRWGKKMHGYPGCAGKGGKTTNYEIPEWMFKRELEEMNGGAANA